jgi:hypothetical protein
MINLSKKERKRARRRDRKTSQKKENWLGIPE